MREQFIEVVEKRPGMVFGHTHPTEEEKYKAVEDMLKSNLKLKSYRESEEAECVICGTRTAFISKITGRHVCSDECLYRENGWEEDCTAENR